MKKILAVLVLLLSAASVSAAELDLYSEFNFENCIIPEYKTHSGDWKIGNPIKPDKTYIDFEEGNGEIKPVKGIWNIESGEYVQSEEGMSSTSRALLKNECTDFSFAFDCTPMSDENTLMIYFGCGSDMGGSSIEINSYQSKLINKGKETVGTGSIFKDNTYRVRLVSEKGNLTLYLNSKPVFSESGIDAEKGKVGIGTWNSRMKYDNIEFYEIPKTGAADMLCGSGKEGLVSFAEVPEDNYVISACVAASDIRRGKIGIAARLDEDGNGIYAVVDKSSAYILKKSAEGRKVLAETEIKPRSEEFYYISLASAGKNITFGIDGEKLLSASDDMSGGDFGIGFKDSAVYIKSVTVERIKAELPPLASEGKTSYYIDSVNGSDLNDGKSENTPWRSVDRVGSFEFKSGDKILFKSGGVYEGSLILNNIKADGEILISAYGEGNPPVLTSCKSVIEIENCNNIKIEGIEVKLRHRGTGGNAETGTGCGISVKNSENIYISACALSAESGSDSEGITAADEKSYSSLRLESVSFDGFSVNGIALGGELKEPVSEAEDMEKHWAYTYMKKLKDRGIISEYRPEDTVTLAEFSVMLISALGLEESEYRGVFADVTADMWYAKKLQTVSDYRLLPTEMTPGKKANAAEGITREGAAAMAALAMEKEAAAAAEYSDMAEASPWAAEYIAVVSENGIMSGKGDSLFCPKDTLTRAEAAVILSRLIDFREESK